MTLGNDCNGYILKKSNSSRILLVCCVVIIALLVVTSPAFSFYYPPSQVPPNPPPNYNQVDSLEFEGTPTIPLPPPDSGGVYIYRDSGKWTIANHIYSKGGSLEQFHGSILAQMEQQPQLNVNIFITDFELWDDTSSIRCLDQNDRWGWVQWDSTLYEIWWDVTTKEFKDDAQDVNDFMRVCIVGCALDFNLWSSGHGGPFSLDQIYLGQSMTRLSDVVGYTDTTDTFINSPFVDTYSGITDPYQSQAGNKPQNDPNITIFTSKALTGASYNKSGLITIADSYVCDTAYGQRYAGSFAYEGNGVQLSIGCNELPNQPPLVLLPDDSSFFICDADSFCYVVFGSDADLNDSVTLCLLEGPISYSCSTAATIVTDTVCFSPDTSGSYRFIWKVEDLLGEIDIDTVIFTVTVNSPPVVSCPPNDTIWVCSLDTPICVGGFTYSDPDNNIETVSVSIGTLSNDTVCFMPDSGDNVIILTVTDSCGESATCTTTISVLVDVTPPVVTCPASITVQCIADVPAPNISLVTATDSCDPNPEIMFVSDSSDGQTCPETITRTYKATDSCGNVSFCTQIITVNDTIAPSITAPADIVFDCVMGDAGTPTDTSDNCGIASISFVDDTTSFRCPLSITRTWTATDSCGNSASDAQIITVQDTIAPILNIPHDTTIYVCSSSDTVCFQISTVDNCDPNPQLDFLNGPGSYDNGIWCLVPGGGTNAIFRSTDSCGNESIAATNGLIFVVNNPPAVNIAARTLDVCPGDSVCVSYTVTDPDNNVTLEELTANPLGAILDTLNNNFCFNAPDSGCYDFILTVTDACGMTDTDTITVCVTELPKAWCPDNFTQFVCDLSQICVPGFSSQNADTVYAIGGTLSGNTVCFIPQNGANTIVLVAENECGVAVCTTIVNVNLNTPPVVTCPNSRTDTVCFIDGPICISGFGVSDQENNLMSCTLNGQPFDLSNPYCFTPVEGANNFTLICIDSCGASSSCSFTIEVVVDPTPCEDSCAVITIEKTNNTPQGRYENVAINIEDMPDSGIGGFDLLIQYDPSALSLSTVEPGDFLANCGWEYFAYRHGPTGTGKVRILALAETNNGALHPSCFYSNAAELAVMTFLVTNDRTFECQYVPIRFCWYDCGDNTLSSKAGDSLYISQAVYYYYDGVIWNEITDISAEFPSLNGANYTCDTDLGDGKPNPIRSLCFYNGGVSIVCAESNGDRGDINLNGVANEVADAVLFGNYFVYGLSVFTINLEGQIAATDVNADGTVLSVADLVYLIRIVIGDALPFSKVVTSVNIDFYHYSDGRLGVGEKTSIGAAYVVAEGEVTPILLATEMDMKYHFDGSNTRILVWSESGSGFTGDFLLLDADLISFELATAEGQPVSLNTLPTTYELLHNYPNPFNPSTVISFTLPGASEYSLTIYNLNGQVVKEFEGLANSAGTVDLEWQAVDVASGVYFYRLEANYGKYVETKKMILLK